MTFTAASLTMETSSAGVRIFSYSTNDTLNTVIASGYFDSVYELFHRGDIILVSGDLDGTVYSSQLTVSSATGATTVTTVDPASITLVSRYVLSTSLAAVGTAETMYLVAPRAGSITKVLGVMNTSGAGSGGTSTVTITVPTTGAIATLPFLQDTAAAAVIEDSTITAHSLAAGAAITVATDGTGSHTGRTTVILEFTPS